MWFWNDWEAQRLLMPFALMSVPFVLLIDVLQLWLRLSAWIPITAGLVIPYLTMGLVERYVRAQVRLRPHPEAIVDARPVVAQGVHAGRALMASMAVVSGVLTVLVLLQVSPAVLGATAVCGGALVFITLRYSRSRARSLAPQSEVARRAELPELTVRAVDGPVVNGERDTGAAEPTTRRA
ncbi:hypothetical protein [Nannocystis radixulma]|uniref:Uncharacterized protein n=1 Tax=Nannocystis radixulma TaxID=2995305 RepID=A0ABT5BFY0_9BACT|nr:hypothetical protein [Nannocystis radixulma]MDC0672434.1 hypothetical protein [Nannocystis radixulma]